MKFCAHACVVLWGVTVALAEEPKPATDLVPEWEEVSVTVVDSSGQHHETNLLEVAHGQGPQADAIFQSLRDGVKDLPAAQVSAFVKAFAVRGFNRRESYSVGGKVVKELTPHDFPLHLADPELFAAEVAFLQDCVAANAQTFLEYPPLSDDERERARLQLDVVFEKLAEVAVQRGLSADARADVAAAKTRAEAYLQRGMYGQALCPLESGQFSRMVDGIGDELPDVVTLSQMTPEEERDAVRAESWRVVKQLMRTRSAAGSKHPALAKKMAESGRALSALNRERMRAQILATRPAASRPTSE